MSILIRGMEMPIDRSLWIVVHSDGTVEANDIRASLGWQTLRNAAVSVPPHGRLTDADDFIRQLSDGSVSDSILSGISYRMSKMPTILEAEESET